MTGARLLLTQVGHVATRWDEQPFITPTLFWYDPEQHTIYFHSNFTGRVRANAERHPEVCFETFEVGRLLPSNVALEFGLQYESVVAFGKIRILEDKEEQCRALYGLLEKYFPTMKPGEHTADRGRRVAPHLGLRHAVDSWSGKRNWQTRADQASLAAAWGEWFGRPPAAISSHRSAIEVIFIQVQF
jgi:nitroimidazol reductase NimA-like FMN-containing flavoprotein (pyridoxamine 5'-phosphate oxidase superfamily)